MYTITRDTLIMSKIIMDEDDYVDMIHSQEKELKKLRELKIEFTKPELSEALAENARLKKKLDKLYEAALEGIDHVGSMNSSSREREARNWVYNAYEGKV